MKTDKARIQELERKVKELERKLAEVDGKNYDLESLDMQLQAEREKNKRLAEGIEELKNPYNKTKNFKKWCSADYIINYVRETLLKQNNDDTKR